MRTLSAPAIAALLKRNVTIRDFLWIEARNGTTGDPVDVGYWSDLGTVSAQIDDPRVGSIVTRDFQGAGGLINISPITLVSNLSVQTITISLSQIADPNDLVRGYDVKQARVGVFRGLFAPATLVQLSPCYSRFLGFVDQVEIETPAESGEGKIELTCVSHSQEMSRRNTATRSDADMKKRTSGDTFCLHSAAVGTWEMNWGKASSASGGVPPVSQASLLSIALNTYTGQNR
ncbi:hypothetical protein [Pseudorhodobacter sp.]|uniref:hypothetical protein n=1 Tax=Pseudorhodobacter sp. TaxID=1934400 RepID=UPI00264947CB|nr:hypothetical protein [Pseudorhodobacter sp.]MDN5786907.1 hypothetical protein [Pseudorhodobacter sp.]